MMRRVKQGVVKDFEIHDGQQSGWIEFVDGEVVPLLRQNMENWKSLRGIRIGKPLACELDHKERVTRIYHIK